MDRTRMCITNKSTHGYLSTPTLAVHLTTPVPIRVHSKILLRSILSVAVQCNALCNIHCNAEIRPIIPKFYSRAVILLQSSSATVDIIPNNLVFSYVILLWSSELQPKLQRTLMTSFQKFAPEQ